MGSSRIDIVGLGCLWLAMIAGCGVGYETVRLEGEFRIDGELVEEGGITFSPLEEKRGRGVYAPVVKGRYVAEDVPVGNARVTFLALEYTGRQVNIRGTPAPESRIIVPAKYRAGIDIEVDTGDTSRNFDLSNSDQRVSLR